MPGQARLGVPDDNNPPSRHWITIREAVRRREELGLSTAEIGRHLGLATSSITRAIEKMVEGTG